LPGFGQQGTFLTGFTRDPFLAPSRPIFGLQPIR